jgi:hypothetical protein
VGFGISLSPPQARLTDHQFSTQIAAQISTLQITTMVRARPDFRRSRFFAARKMSIRFSLFALIGKLLTQVKLLGKRVHLASIN